MIRNKDHNKLGTIIMVGIGGIVVGIGLIGFGLFSFPFIGTGGAAMVGLGILLSSVGCCMTLGAVIYGIRQEKGDSTTTEIVVVHDAHIIGRYATNGIGEMLFDEQYLDFDDPKTKLYLKIEVPGRPSIELKTNQAVWLTCGEGMKGIAHLQGSWLGKFEPSIRGPQ
ncbi:MAG: hypothetical protein ABL962_11695, partial [Fimbriimonadaceae bacterium]